MTRILIIRLSSIGDIVLTTPIIRCLKEQWAGEVEIHYLTKKAFKPVLVHNPHLAQLHLVENKVEEVIPALQEIGFDHVIDLHKNLRSAKVKRAIDAPNASFSKENIKKWLLVNLSWDVMPRVHIVDRYFQAVETLQIENDLQGLDYFLGPQDDDAIRRLPESHQQGYLAWVVGAAHATKAVPVDKSVSILSQIKMPVVLLGGPTDKEKGGQIAREAGDHVHNACGQFQLNESAALVKGAQKVVTPDTGLMHVASAFHQDIYVLWGNTVRSFGMFPYLPEGKGSYRNGVVEGLRCRPCSKIGFDKCPRRHFRCMKEQDESAVVQWALA